MADNLGYTPGTGADVATEEVGGIHHQKVLVEHGGADGVTPTPASVLDPMPVHDEEGHLQLTRIVAMLVSPSGYDRSLQRLRVTAQVETGSTVSTVANLTNIDGRNGAMLINQTSLSAWADCVRARIS